MEPAENPQQSTTLKGMAANNSQLNAGTGKTAERNVREGLRMAERARS